MAESNTPKTEVHTPREYFVKGKQFFDDNKLSDATKFFRKAYKGDRDVPEYMSYYGMCAALKKGEIKLGLELCTRAIKKEFHRADYYRNLAKVYIAAGNKKGAIQVLSKGMRFEKRDELLHKMLVELGVRDKPVLPFLRRANPANKYLGILARRTLPQMSRKKGPKKK